MSHLSCSKKETLGEQPVIPGGQIMQLEHSSNADTLFLYWIVVKKEMDFTESSFSAGNVGSSVEVGRNESKCYLTDIPYR